MEKDTKWKTFFEDNRRYADVINGLGCGGRQLVSAVDLQEEDSTSGKRIRDALRRVALGMNFVIVGIENQEEPDYKINIIEIRNLKHTEMFQTDVKQVFDFIRLSGDKEALLELVEGDDNYHHMDEDAFEVITTYTNSKELREQMEKMQQESRKGEKKDMCKAIRDLMDDSNTEQDRRTASIWDGFQIDAVV